MVKEIDAAVVAEADAAQAEKLMTLHTYDNTRQFALGQAEALRTFIEKAEMALASPDPRFYVELMLKDMKERIEASHEVAGELTEAINDLKEEI